MKIEKVNDNQIRCTLTREDLEKRHMKLSELAYGTEKARSLFREMMNAAEDQYGFEADDIPLMIEAVPVSSESIILIITKVDYPEELDTRFSSFTSDDDTDYDDEELSYAGFSDDESNLDRLSKSANEILNLFDRAEGKSAGQTSASTGSVQNNTSADTAELTDVTKLFGFTNLDDIIQLAHSLQGFYDEENALYKDSKTQNYYLILRKGHHTPSEFNKVCNLICEYGSSLNYAPGSDRFMDEHLSVILYGAALQKLAEI